MLLMKSTSSTMYMLCAMTLQVTLTRGGHGEARGLGR